MDSSELRERLEGEAWLDAAYKVALDAIEALEAAERTIEQQAAACNDLTRRVGAAEASLRHKADYIDELTTISAQRSRDLDAACARIRELEGTVVELEQELLENAIMVPPVEIEDKEASDA